MFGVNELLKATEGRLVSCGPIHIKGVSIDSRTINPQDAFIAIRGSNFDGHDFIDEAIKKGASCIIKEASNKKLGQKDRLPLLAHKKAERITFIEVKDTIKALGGIARFQRQKFGIPVIAVTGSNGKTTAKEMIAGLLSRKFRVLKNEGTKNNQIGLPLALVNLNSSYDIAVLEVGTNHFGEVDYLSRICQPNIAVITNIGPAHLEYLRDLDGVFREKYKIIENLRKPYIGILNADDNLLNRKVSRGRREPVIFGFGIKNRCDFFASGIKNISEKLEFRINLKYKFRLKTLGYYNIYNALAAIAAGRIFGMAYKDIVLALANFDFPPGRLQFIKLNHTRFIDDTYNSNPLSLRQALNTLANFRTKGRKIVVMGDMLELGPQTEIFHRQAGKEAARHCDILITIGKLSKLAADAAGKAGLNTGNIFACQTHSEARDILFKRLSLGKDDLVLVKGSRFMKMEEILKDYQTRKVG